MRRSDAVEVVEIVFKDKVLTMNLTGNPTAVIETARGIGHALFSEAWHFTALNLKLVAPQEIDALVAPRPTDFHVWSLYASAITDRQAIAGAL